MKFTFELIAHRARTIVCIGCLMQSCPPVLTLFRHHGFFIKEAMMPESFTLA